MICPTDVDATEVVQVADVVQTGEGDVDLAVLFPTPDQVDLATRFGTRSGDDVDKLASERWREGPHGPAGRHELPLLPNRSRAAA